MANEKFQQLREKWRSHVRNYESSGLSIADYCRTNQINLRQMYSWRSRLSDKKAAPAAAKKKKSPAFVSVQLDAKSPKVPPISPPARLAFNSGAALELDSTMDPIWVARLISAVGGRP